VNVGIRNLREDNAGEKEEVEGRMDQEFVVSKGGERGRDVTVIFPLDLRDGNVAEIAGGSCEWRRGIRTCRCRPPNAVEGAVVMAEEDSKKTADMRRSW
jgi:hypothetical protein